MKKKWIQWLRSAAIASFWITPVATSALAQNILFDGTLRSSGPGPASTDSSVPNGYLIRVNDGYLVGNNLFHSFARFNLNLGEVASFQTANPVPIRNVLVRITGGIPSAIDGQIRVSGNANLFLINPNGISFGPNAKLTLGGSFFATTVDAIQFPHGERFSATIPDGRGSLLNIVGDPSGFLASQRSIPPISVSGQLTVPFGQSLVLLGGDIQLDGTGFLPANKTPSPLLGAPGGRIELGGVSGVAELGLTANGNLWSLSFPSQTPRADVTLQQFPVQVIASNGGNVAINARNLTISNSQIAAGIREDQGSETSQSGNISLNATETIAITHQSQVANVINGRGQGGDVDIQTQQRLIVQDSQVQAAVFGRGNAGNLAIIVGESVDLSGDYIQGAKQGPGGLFAQVNSTPNTTGIGQGGNLTIVTPLLRVRDGSKVQTAGFGQGNAGNIAIRSQNVEVIDTPDIPNIFPTAINAGVTLTLNPEIDTRNDLKGNGGNLTIETNRLTVQGGQVTVENFGIGAAGNLVINADLIQLSDRAKLTAETRSGQGGDITLNVNSLLRLQGNSQISTTAGNAQAGGDGGNITINTPKGFVVSPPFENSDITANAFSGRGGKVTINARFVVALPNENSDITANAFAGRGGRVDITTQGLFGLVPHTQAELKQLLGNGPLDPQRLPTNDITASSQFGLSGTVVINTLNVDPSRGLVQLPGTPVDPTNQIRQTCRPTGTQQASSFVITGRGGIPISPERTSQQTPLPEWVAVDSDDRTQTISTHQGTSPLPTPVRLSAHDEAHSSFGEAHESPLPNPPIVEAQGWIKDAQGNVWLVSDAPAPSEKTDWNRGLGCR